MYRLTVTYTVIYKVISALTFYHFNSGNYISMNFLLNCLEISPKTIILLMDRHDSNSNNRHWPNKRMNSWYCSSWQCFTEKNRQIVGFHGCKKWILLITQLIECLFSFCTFPVVVFCWLFLILFIYLLFIYHYFYYLFLLFIYLLFYFIYFLFYYHLFIYFFIIFFYIYIFFFLGGGGGGGGLYDMFHRKAALHDDTSGLTSDLLYLGIVVLLAYILVHLSEMHFLE